MYLSSVAYSVFVMRNISSASLRLQEVSTRSQRLELHGIRSVYATRVCNVI